MSGQDHMASRDLSHADVCQCGHFATPEDPLIDGECEECHFAHLAEAEEAEDRRRDNPLEPDYRRLGV